MLIRAGYDIIFEHPAPTPIITMLYLHPSRGPSIRRGDYLLVEPPVQVSDYTDVFGNRCGRLVAPAGPHSILERRGGRGQQASRTHGIPPPNSTRSTICRMRRLPSLMPSRCEVDRMVDLAWQLFGTVPKGWAQYRRSATSCIITSCSTTCRPARPAPPTKPTRSESASVVILPTWRSRSAAA